jgi:hypothetical protein
VLLTVGCKLFKTVGFNVGVNDGGHTQTFSVGTAVSITVANSVGL